MDREVGTADAMREQIAAQVEAGADLAEVSRSIIEPAPVDEDQKAALWLFAWCTATRAAGSRPEQ